MGEGGYEPHTSVPASTPTASQVHSDAPGGQRGPHCKPDDPAFADVVGDRCKDLAGCSPCRTTNLPSAVYTEPELASVRTHCPFTCGGYEPTGRDTTVESG